MANGVGRMERRNNGCEWRNDREGVWRSWLENVAEIEVIRLWGVKKKKAEDSDGGMRVG